MIMVHGLFLNQELTDSNSLKVKLITLLKPKMKSTLKTKLNLKFTKEPKLKLMHKKRMIIMIFSQSKFKLSLTQLALLLDATMLKTKERPHIQ
jgi:hypothetical protein